jgi:tight adherence protein C
VVDGDRAAGGWWQQLRRQRERRWRDLQVVAQLPDVVDLLRLTTSAGLPVALALKVVGDRPGGPVGQAFRRSAIRLRRGAALADVLPQLTAICGEPARSLVDALVDHDRYGTPLGPALDRLAIESRLKRRRQAEEAARRLPVVLLFPLVFTTLPAFLLLAVVPLVAGSLAALGR